MWGSILVYTGVILTAVGLVRGFNPFTRFRRSRGRALAGSVAGVVLVLVGFGLPAGARRVGQATSSLDRLVPAWQFREVHSLRIDAPPARVYEAIQRLSADEIFLFRALTWIRRGGRPGPPSILNAGGGQSLIDVATQTGFVRLADSAPHELVIGSVVVAPAGVDRPSVTGPLPRGSAMAAMNFVVTPDGTGGSVVVTETRVFANSPGAVRRFAVYWRIIYPGSAIIRRMWLRAIRHRATAT